MGSICMYINIKMLAVVSIREFAISQQTRKERGQQQRRKKDSVMPLFFFKKDLIKKKRGGYNVHSFVYK
jgi:hypothetical protein